MDILGGNTEQQGAHHTMYELVSAIHAANIRYVKPVWLIWTRETMTSFLTKTKDDTIARTVSQLAVCWPVWESTRLASQKEQREEEDAKITTRSSLSC
jgi:hypothetical protein